MKTRVAKVVIGSDEFLVTDEVVADYGTMQVIRPVLYKRVMTDNETLEKLRQRVWRKEDEHEF